ARAFLQMTAHVAARSEPRRRCSEQEGGNHTAEKGESQNANIKWNRKAGFAADRQMMSDEIFRPHRQQQTERTADQRHQHTFRKQLPKQLRSTGAECNANREFTRASSEAGQEEISKIGARDQQYEARQTKTEPHDRPFLFGGRVAQRQHAQPITRLGFRVLLGKASCQRLHLRVGLGDRNAGLEPAKRETPLVSAALPLTGCESERPQKVHLRPEQRIIKLLGHDADDGDILAVEPQRAPDDISVALKALLPKMVAENDHPVVSCPVLLLGETASELGSNSEGWKNIRSHEHPRQKFRRFARCREIAWPLRIIGCDALEHRIFLAQIQEYADGMSVPGGPAGNSVNAPKPVGIGK